MKIRKQKKTIGSSKFSPPVGFQIVPSAPAGGLTSAAAMRPQFAFLPYNVDEVNAKIYQGMQAWRAQNPSTPADQFPGIPDLFGGSGKMGAGPQAPNPDGSPKGGCPGGQRWRSDNQRCECPGSDKWCTPLGRCVSLFDYVDRGCFL